MRSSSLETLMPLRSPATFSATTRLGRMMPIPLA